MSKKAWRIFTIFMLICLVTSPVTMSYVAYLDYMGFDLLLMLLEVQIIFVASYVYGKAFKPWLSSLSTYRRAKFRKG